MAAKLHNMIGEVYGRLTVLVRIGSTPHNVSTWLCVCECGKTKTIRRDCLLQGTTTSCGCYAKEASSKRNAKHGEAYKRTVEYATWSSMRSRCNNPTNKDYASYGDRGIIVCERWNSYENFLADMGRKPTPEHSLDRINNDGEYSSHNCRWATRSEQQRNKTHLQYAQPPCSQ